ncbi:MAG TPA: cyclic nucleotide-binding and patatin-like phospholipase domain-containing protein [Roseiflexaceae bacterium]|nr:cyclic nucleotide-binding and patatin-like phospholipase domain-containing protein [Roseiflexaceae bacterium]HMP39292.1 cyclic nucleotide-binding and patatin-like phospholipase domain-containing protein [Roseiflexaceae bacterium]
MNDSAPPPVDLVALLAGSALFAALDTTAHAEIAAECRPITLPAGALLFAQGDPGDSLYIIARGRMGVRMHLPDGTSTELDTHGPGVSVGEMGILTGQPRVADVYAQEASLLFQLTHAGFEHLAARHPELIQQLHRASAPRIMRTQLADALAGLFGPLEQQALHELQAALEWRSLAPGEVLFNAGEPGDSCYIVINGRLCAMLVDQLNEHKILNEIGRGECVGELALITGEPRTATVYAMRESSVVRLSNELFQHLISRHPYAMLQITRLIARRAQPAAEQTRRQTRAATFTLVAAHPDTAISGLAHQLADALSAFGPTLLLDAARLNAALNKPDAAQTTDDDPTSLALLGWLNQHMAAYQYVVFVADPTWSQWTRRCIRQADRILIVAQAGNDPTPGPIEQTLAEQTGYTRTELVLQHPADCIRPRGTMAWLAPRTVFTHHHLRLNHQADLARLVRRLTGRAFGLVLGGGGARGYVHVGAIRALHEANIPIDMIAGTSMGALIGAGYAIDYTWEELSRMAQRLSHRKQLLDLTLPFVSFAATAKVTRLYQQLFTDLQIEDLWSPFCCISSNLSNATPQLHRHGPLWAAIRASSAIPGIFAPIQHENGDILIDGGVMNNFPLDVMRDVCEAGTVIGVSAAPAHDKSRKYHFGPSVSGWRVLAGRLGLARKIRAPSLFGSVMRATEINSVYTSRSPAFRRLADLIIQPPVEQFRVLDFDAHAAIIEVGYQAARDQLAAWQRSSIHYS